MVEHKRSYSGTKWKDVAPYVKEFPIAQAKDAAEKLGHTMAIWEDLNGYLGGTSEHYFIARCDVCDAYVCIRKYHQPEGSALEQPCTVTRDNKYETMAEEFERLNKEVKSLKSNMYEDFLESSITEFTVFCLNWIERKYKKYFG